MCNTSHPTNKDLQRSRDEFRSLLELRSAEAQWQKFFSEHPYVLSMSLPLRLTPEEIVPLGRPGRQEPDFVFFAQGYAPLPTYGVIELKKPDSKIVTVTRSNAAILSRDAETAMIQATEYARTHPFQLHAKPDSILALGNDAHLFVIMGMSSELSRKLGLELYRELVEKRLPRNLRIIPYDTLLLGFEGQIQRPLHVLVPAASNIEPSLIAEPTGPLFRVSEALKHAIQSLPPAERIVFVLRDVEALAQKEVAEMLGLSESAISHRLRRARASLAEAIGSDSTLTAALKLQLDLVRESRK